MNDQADKLYIHGPPDANGYGVATRIDKDGNARTGSIRLPKDGVPLGPNEEMILTSPGECPHERIVHDTYRVPGPSRAVTNAYREGYDRVFGGKPS